MAGGESLKWKVSLETLKEAELLKRRRAEE